MNSKLRLKRKIVEPQTQANAEDQESIKVAIRWRPLNSRETGPNIVNIQDQSTITLINPEADSSLPPESFRNDRRRSKAYTFDMCFTEETSQKEVFQKTTQDLIQGVINGFNATVFAYGATGAGKTYTMLGNAKNPGISIQTVQDLFQYITQLDSTQKFTIQLGMLEIYNETIRDLINPTNEVREIREDPLKGNTVTGLTQIYMTSVEDVIATIRMADKNRTKDPTSFTATSSRSHSLMQIIMQQSNRDHGQVIVAKLSLIDLAGCERASASMKNRNLRVIEGANINRSLLALGNCITALFEKQTKGGKIHIPYRDSKLTRLLKDSLGGNWRTIMVAWISPHDKSYEITQNTLKYAAQAKNIKGTITRNVLDIGKNISKFNEIVKSLKNEINDLRRKLDTTPTITGAGICSSPKHEFEKGQIAINSHFTKEAQARKKVYEIQQEIQQLGFQIQKNYLEMSQDGATPKARKQQLTLKTSMVTLDKKLIQAEKLVTKLEIERSDIEKQAVSDSQDKLGLSFTEKVIKIDRMCIRHKENKTKAIAQQKQMYIEALENQLKIRDEIIDQQSDIFRSHNLDRTFDFEQSLMDIGTMKELGNHSSIVYPLDSDYYTQDKLSLPPIHLQNHKSRIPKIKPRIPKPTSLTPTKSGNKYHMSNFRTSKQLRINVLQPRPTSSHSDGSTASTGSQHAIKSLSSVAAKYSKSPYVSYRNNKYQSKSPQPQRTAMILNRGQKAGSKRRSPVYGRSQNKNFKL